MQGACMLKIRPWKGLDSKNFTFPWQKGPETWCCANIALRAQRLRKFNLAWPWGFLAFWEFFPFSQEVLQFRRERKILSFWGAFFLKNFNLARNLQSWPSKFPTEKKRGLVGGSLEMFNLAWKFQSQRAILNFFNLWALWERGRKLGAAQKLSKSAKIIPWWQQ